MASQVAKVNYYSTTISEFLTTELELIFLDN